MDRKRLAQDISNAAQNKIIVTGLEDEVDIKTFTMSNSEKIYTGLIQFANKEVSNLILGSESMAGGMQSYVAPPRRIRHLPPTASRCTAATSRT